MMLLNNYPYPNGRLFIQAAALLAAIAGNAILLLSNNESSSSLSPSPANTNSNLLLRTVVATTTNNGGHRQLSLIDPQTIQLKPTAQRQQLSDISPSNPLAINVYVAYQMHPTAESHLFETDTTTKYGTGRVHWNLIVHGKNKPTKDPGPCIAIGHHANKRWSTKDFKLLARAYPSCKYMNNNDEVCKAPDGFHFRQYHSSQKPGYHIPLGMRFDTWNAYEAMKSDPNFAIKAPSQRKYAFNCIISLSTNYERQDLAKMIEKEEKEGAHGLTNFVQLTNHWRAKPTTDNTKYMQLLLDSAFTLSPTGHSPECFRIYEAIEAGSIPVMVKYEPQPFKRCKDVMKYWYEAPMLFLEKWEDLYPTVEELMNKPEVVDEMMIKLKDWYYGFMKKTVVGMEDYMIQSYFGNNDGALSS